MEAKTKKEILECKIESLQHLQVFFRKELLKIQEWKKELEENLENLDQHLKVLEQEYESEKQKLIPKNHPQSWSMNLLEVFKNFV